MTTSGSYSQIADQQLDELEQGPDPALYAAALDACELVFIAPSKAQAMSTAIQTDEGIRFRLPIAGHPPHRVFWSQSLDGPRIEAVFPHPST